MSEIELHDCEHTLVAENVNFADSSVRDVSFEDANFTNVSFERSEFSMVSFENATLDYVRFDGCKMKMVSFREVELTAQSCEGMTIDGISVVDLITAYQSKVEK